MPQIDLEGLRKMVRSRSDYEKSRLGEDEANLYIRIGPNAGRFGFRSETRMGADGREVIFDIDEQGLLRGIEFQ